MTDFYEIFGWIAVRSDQEDVINFWTRFVPIRTQTQVNPAQCKDRQTRTEKERHTERHRLQTDALVAVW